MQIDPTIGQFGAQFLPSIDIKIKGSISQLSENFKVFENRSFLPKIVEHSILL